MYKYIFLVICSIFLFSCAGQQPESEVSEISEASAEPEMVSSETEVEEENDDVSVEVIEFDGYEKMVEALDDKKIYVINFWAVWCKPCVEELPYFNKLNNEYDNVEVILVSLDFSNTLETRVKPFIRKNDLPERIYLLDDVDYDSWIDKVSEQWGGAIPASVIIDKSKDRYDFYEQSFNYKELVKTVSP